ncbi:type II toxin-antitoxin system PemK/MazF family toxin [Candidatus Kaiserbacteria bacterium]|nr:type II toxin-antitoxin system PemK/MazF family toxin [Candidatus Kaiserbacteria bacterium]
MSRPKNSFPRRGEIWWINFDPSIGTESAKTRPAIIMSNNVSNEFLERVQVVPLTSNVTKIYPSETVVVIRGKKNKAAADQVATVSKRRIRGKIGTVSDNELASIEFVLKLQLGLA